MLRFDSATSIAAGLHNAFGSRRSRLSDVQYADSTLVFTKRQTGGLSRPS